MELDAKVVVDMVSNFTVLLSLMTDCKEFMGRIS